MCFGAVAALGSNEVAAPRGTSVMANSHDTSSGGRLRSAFEARSPVHTFPLRSRDLPVGFGSNIG